METSELLKKVRKIEIKTRGLSRNIFAGEYHSAFKGRGMTFAEVREYQYGDDIRNIDWNVTARFGHPYVKIFEEERELTVMLLIDVSGSGEFGSGTALKQEILTEIAAVLAFSAIQNNDKIGVIFFSDRIEKFIPPQKGRKHILYIIREMLDFKPQSRKTDLNVALQYFTNAMKKRCTAFLLSDFIAENNFDNALSIVSQKHDLVCVRLYDIRDAELPSVGWVKMKDAESGEAILVNTSSKTVRADYQKTWEKRFAEQKTMFTRCGIDNVSIEAQSDYVQALIGFFKSRK